MHHAHSTDDSTRANWQGLADHLHGVADLAGAYGDRIGIGRAARLAGLPHDLGKYSKGFQARLAGAKEAVDHSTAGAALAIALARSGRLEDRLMAELAGYAVSGHHAGLPDRLGESKATLTERLAHFDEGLLDAIWKSEIAPDVSALLPGFSWELEKRSDPKPLRDRAKARLAFQFAFLGRMVFSTLVDSGAWIETARARLRCGSDSRIRP